MALNPSDINGFLVDREYPPCEHWGARGPCGDVDRFIVHVPSNSGFKLVCGAEHNHTHEGKTFIPAYELCAGGVFADVDIPAHLRPSEERDTNSRWRLSKLCKKRLEKRDTCLSCETPPFLEYGKQNSYAILFEWLTLYDRALAATVQDFLHDKVVEEACDWYLEIANDDLGMTIQNRLNLSILSNDHGVPKKYGNKLWRDASTAARTLLKDLLVFRICRKCNLERGAGLFSAGRLEELFILSNYDGSKPAAVADSVRWRAFQEILAALYASAVA